MLEDKLKAVVRDIADFPQPGIVFKDITPILKDAELCREIVVEITNQLKDVEIETPIAKTTQKELAGKKVAIIPILRAGIGMVDGMTDLIPAAKIGFIGMYRDEENLKPHEYFVKLPNENITASPYSPFSCNNPVGLEYL